MNYPPLSTVLTCVLISHLITYSIFINLFVKKHLFWVSKIYFIVIFFNKNSIQCNYLRYELTTKMIIISLNFLYSYRLNEYIIFVKKWKKFKTLTVQTSMFSDRNSSHGRTLFPRNFYGFAVKMNISKVLLIFESYYYTCKIILFKM